MSANEAPGHEPRGGGKFASTHWSIVLAAGHRSSPDSRAALARLCEAYWFPLYAYARRRVGDVHEAQDLTQEREVAGLVELNGAFRIPHCSPRRYADAN